MKTFFAAIILLLTQPSYAFNCDGAKVAQLLNGLTNIGRLHNCKIEILRIENEDLVSFLVYGKDLYRCETTERVCPQANFEVTVPKSCLSKSYALSEVEMYSSGYNLDNRKHRNHIQIKQNGHMETVQMAFGQTDLESVQRLNYVSCKLNPLGDL